MFGRSRQARQTQATRGAAAPPTAAPGGRLERMFLAHHGMVWRTLRRRGLTADAAADATQQAFLIAAERLNDIQTDSERAFLVGTALRVARTLGRKTMRWQLEEDMDRRVLETGDHASARAAVELCDLALSRVDADVAEVFVLFEIEGLTSPEIAASLEIPLGTVASRLRRAREQFRRVVTRIESTMHREGTS